jgi:hypothetical protein
MSIIDGKFREFELKLKVIGNWRAIGDDVD